MQDPGTDRLAPDNSAAYFQPRLVVLGTDFRQAGVGLRERISLGGDRRAQALAALQRVADEGLIVSTCNRTELYAVVTAPCRETAAGSVRAVLAEVTGVGVEDVRRATTARHGRDAVRHLLRVASGLESIVLGEPQILGQLRESLSAAQEAGATGPVLARLATDALRVGKQTRTMTGIARNRLSIPHAALDLATRVLGGLSGRAALVVGAGEMGSLSTRLLRGAGVREVTIANRTLRRAEDLAASTGGRAVPLANLPEELARADVVFGTADVAAGEHLVDAALLDRVPARRATLLLVDLGLPRTFDPAVADRPGVRLFDVDDLHETTAEVRTAYAEEVACAEQLVESAAEAFLDWWAARAAAPAIAALRQHADAIRTAELERALARLGHLSERDRAVVAALSVGLTNKLLHTPVTRLRDADRLAAAIAAARTLFPLERDEGDAAGEERHGEPVAAPHDLAVDRDERRRTA